MKFLLIQIREQPWKIRWDRNSFFKAIGIPRKAVKVVNVFDGELQMKDLDGFDAVIIGGSKYGTYDKVPNMALLKKFIKKAVKKNLPMLGVCFGAQLIAQALGGKVVLDRKNQEFGTFIMELTKAGRHDPLFSKMLKNFRAQCAHHDRISRLPKGAINLARSRKCAVQAFRISGTWIYGLQFHPERSARAYKEGVLYELNQLPLRQRELKNLPLRKILRAIKSTKTETVFRNFLKVVKSVVRR